MLNAYDVILSNVKERDFKIIQDIKLVKLCSLTCNLVWYNKALKSYNGHKINFEPLISLMEKKNRYFYLCKLKLHQAKLEFSKDIENLFFHVIASAYNSMIDTHNLEISTIADESPLIVKEHSVKVEEVNLSFKELCYRINEELTHKFPKTIIEPLANIQFTI